MIADASALLRRTGTRQLVKFCFVGASSTLIDKGILWLLLSVTPRTPWWISASMSFCLAVTNGFVWNRRWTFLARSGAVRHAVELRGQQVLDIPPDRCGGATGRRAAILTPRLRRAQDTPCHPRRVPHPPGEGRCRGARGGSLSPRPSSPFHPPCGGFAA